MSIAQEVTDDVQLGETVALGAEQVVDKLLDLAIAILGHQAVSAQLSAKAIARDNAIADAAELAKFGGGK